MPVKDLRKMNLHKYETGDPTRENLAAIESYILDEVITKAKWEFKEIEIEGSFTNAAPFLFKHNVTFIPRDVLITSTKTLEGQSSKGTVTVDYDNITENFIPFTCTSPGAMVRFFYGSYKEIKR